MIKKFKIFEGNCTITIEQVLEYSYLKRYLDNGCNPSRVIDNYSLLMLSIDEPNNMILLIDAGADWTHIDENGYSFIDMLPFKEAKKIIELYPDKHDMMYKKIKSNEFNL